MKINARNVVRVAIVVISVIYVLGAEVEASKNRKNQRRHRSKRMHGEKPRKHHKKRKHQTKTGSIPPKEASLIEIVEAHSSLGPIETMREENRLKIPHRHYEEYLKDRRPPKKEEGKQETHDSTMMPLVYAKINFFKHSEILFEPTTKAVTRITSHNSAGFVGLQSFHKSKGKFGLHCTAETVYGRIVHIQDAGRTDSHFGCGNAIANLHEIPAVPWIAMIERGHCSFFTKIKLAERNNASAVIIYNNNAGEVPKINTIGTNIVSVIIGKHDGHHVAKAVQESKVMASIEVDTNPYETTTPRGGAMTNSRVSAVTILVMAMTALYWVR